jgi:hypothetical protein
MGKQYFKKPPGEVLTMFLCDDCGTNLTSTENFHGTTCGKCISKQKGNGLQQAAVKRNEAQEAAILKQVKEWEYESGLIPIKNGTVNYLGKEYYFNIFMDKSNKTKAVIRIKKDMEVIYAEGEGTPEGKDVYEYCKLESIFNQKTI